MKLPTLLIGVMLCTALNSSIAQEYVIEDYTVEVRVFKEGYFDVTEHISVQFHVPKRGIIRKIPLTSTVQGKEHRIKINQVEVPNWRKQIDSGRNFKSIRIGDKDTYLTGRQEYTIKYRVYKAFLNPDAQAEFYWNMVGTEWDVPIENISYEIHLEDAPALGRQDYEVFTGLREEGNFDADINYNQSTISGKSIRPFEVGEGLTVAIRLPNDYLQIPSFFAKIARDNSGVPLALAGIVFLLSSWFRRDRKKPSTLISDKAIYYAPNDLSPAVAGALLDGRRKYCHLMSMIPQWANQGLIDIFGARGKYSPDYFQLEKKNEISHTRPDFEVTFFKGVFALGSVVSLTSLRNVMHTHLAKARHQLKKELVSAGYYDSQSIRIYHSKLILFLSAASFIGAILLFIFTPQIITGSLLILLAIVCLIIYGSRQKLSESGEKMKEKLESFKKHLADPDLAVVQRLLDEDAAYFERNLPYAMAFGIDESWIKQVQPYLELAPVWYYYHDDHTQTERPSFDNFTDQFRVPEISSAFASSPATSSSVGSSGGGASSGTSGGGFGGGGGSSW